jgi:hypothetical protein
MCNKLFLYVLLSSGIFRRFYTYVQCKIFQIRWLSAVVTERASHGVQRVFSLRAKRPDYKTDNSMYAYIWDSWILIYIVPHAFMKWCLATGGLYFDLDSKGRRVSLNICTTYTYNKYN